MLPMLPRGARPSLSTDRFAALVANVSVRAIVLRFFVRRGARLTRLHVLTIPSPHQGRAFLSGSSPDSPAWQNLRRMHC